MERSLSVSQVNVVASDDLNDFVQRQDFNSMYAVQHVMTISHFNKRSQCFLACEFENVLVHESRTTALEGFQHSIHARLQRLPTAYRHE